MEGTSLNNNKSILVKNNLSKVVNISNSILFNDSNFIIVTILISMIIVYYYKCSAIERPIYLHNNISYNFIFNKTQRLDIYKTFAKNEMNKYAIFKFSLGSFQIGLDFQQQFKPS